jgi:hypothetical protein
VAGTDLDVTWNDRLFESIPLAPARIGVALAIGLIALYVTLMAWLGYVDELQAQGLQVWKSRDARFGVLLVLVAVYTPVARRYASLGARDNLAELAPLLASHSDARGPATPLRVARSRRRGRVGGWMGMAIVPVMALLIDRDPTLYFQSYYWGGPQLWTYAFGFFVGWQVGRFLSEQAEDARYFSALAERLPAIDLFDPRPLAPFVRQGLRGGLLWIVFVSLYSFNLVDTDALASVALMWLLGLAFSLPPALLPLLGVHRRIRAAKRTELDRVDAALRDEPDALASSALERRAGGVSVADLVAYRGLVSSVREWPFDAGARWRILLYLSIPVGSWLGGAFVERILGAALD